LRRETNHGQAGGLQDLLLLGRFVVDKVGTSAAAKNNGKGAVEVENR